MKYTLIFIKSFLAILLIATVALAAPSIDGEFEVGEWTIDGTAHFAEEDSADNVNYLSPGTGGQDFDVEYLGLFIEDDTLYFGLQTGFELNYKERAGGTNYYPGDIALDFSPVGDTDIDYQFGFRFRIPGIQGLNTGQEGVQYVAELKTYYDPSWSDPAIYEEAGPYRKIGGDRIYPGYAASYQRFGGSSSDPHHNTLEASVNLSALTSQLTSLDLGSSYDVTVHWTMGCGNDFLDQTFTFNAPHPVPEPATILLLGAGLACFAGTRKKLIK